MERTVIRYSEAFKQQVVNELEQGKFSTTGRARRAYGIKGSDTIRNWIIRYGNEKLLPKKVRIETLKERNELKEARQRIRELEVAIADAHIECCLESSYLRIACERMDVEPEIFKKKNAIKLSDIRKQRIIK